MPDVQVTRRIGVHRQQVIAVAGLGQGGLVQAQLVPPRLPARLDRGGGVTADPGLLLGVLRVGHGLGQGSWSRRPVAARANQKPPALIGKGSGEPAPLRAPGYPVVSASSVRAAWIMFEAVPSRALVELGG